MSVDGIHSVYIETHNWGKSVAYWKALGYSLSDDFGNSGILRPTAAGQPYLFLEEVSADAPLATYLVLNARREFQPDSPVEVTSDWEDSHWETRIMMVRDPDGRDAMVQVGGE